MRGKDSLVGRSRQRWAVSVAVSAGLVLAACGGSSKKSSAVNNTPTTASSDASSVDSTTSTIAGTVAATTDTTARAGVTTAVTSKSSSATTKKATTTTVKKAATGSSGNNANVTTPTTSGVKATGDPVQLNFVNATEDPNTTSNPAGWDGGRAAASYINDVYGGVNGRPLKLTLCNTTSAPESGTACAGKLLDGNPVAVVAGLTAVADGYMTALKNAGMPYITAAPLTGLEYTSPNSFAMSGSGATAGAAIAAFSVNDLKVKKMVLMYADAPSILTITNSIKGALQGKGVSVDLIPMPLATPDMAPLVSAALSRNPDAVFQLGGLDHCIGTFKALAATPAPNVKFLYSGTCASPAAVASAPSGAEGGYYVSAIGTTSSNDADFGAYQYAMKTYYPKTDLQSASAIGFSAVMDTYEVLRGMTGDINKDTVMAAFKAAKGLHVFFGQGGTFTCDGKQFPGLQAICAVPSEIDGIKGGVVYRAKTFTSVADLA